MYKPKLIIVEELDKSTNRHKFCMWINTYTYGYTLVSYGIERILTSIIFMAYYCMKYEDNNQWKNFTLAANKLHHAMAVVTFHLKIMSVR